MYNCLKRENKDIITVRIDIDFGGACAPPFCAVQCLSAPLDALLASLRTLSIRGSGCVGLMVGSV